MLYIKHNKTLNINIAYRHEVFQQGLHLQKRLCMINDNVIYKT